MTIPWARIVGILALVVAGLGLIVFGVHRIKADGAAGNIAAQERQHAKDIAEAATKERHIQSEHMAADRESDRFRFQALVDARNAVVAGDRLQQRFAAINAGCVPEHSAASAAGPAASSPADLRADVLRRVVQAAELVASAADGFHGPGLAVVKKYDALAVRTPAASP